MDRNLVDEAVRQMVADGTEKEIGWVDLPSQTPEMPYAVMYPIVSVPGPGSMDAQLEEVDLRYQFKCVGSSPEQCSWMSGKVIEVMTAMVNTAYKFDLTILNKDETESDLKVEWRLMLSAGAILPSDDYGYTCDDEYEVRVQI